MLAKAHLEFAQFIITAISRKLDYHMVRFDYQIIKQRNEGKKHYIKFSCTKIRGEVIFFIICKNKNQFCCWQTIQYNDRSRPSVFFA